MITLTFLGKEIKISGEFLYDCARDYWVSVNKEKNIATFGLTPAGVQKEGGYRSIEFTVDASDQISAGDTIAVAVTGKVKYLEAPASGTVIEVNKALEDKISVIEQAPYVCWWLARIELSGTGADEFTNVEEYCAVLEETDRRTISGIKGAGSPTCRSVYQSIREQKDKCGEGDC
ncbi:MAG: hypothetical protein KGZ63_13220 [Clostridiales bacterium]|jgi:glycine cleavage system H lipoate-binding protein|nr:hypothetical protein [Clostridiales bacterium]